MTLPSLLLLTEHFPYGYGEPFLEAELPHLARQFNVHLLPTSVDASEFSVRRPVPEGVIVAEAIARRISLSAANWASILMKQPWTLLSSLRLAVHEIRGVPRTFWALRRLIRFTIQAALVADQLLGKELPPRFDIYYSYWLSSNALSLVLGKKAGRGGRFVSRAHRGDLYVCHARREFQPFRRTLVENLDRIILISEHGRDYLRGLFPDHEDKLEVLRLGVNASTFCSQAGGDEALHIVSCSNLSPVKRIDLLVDALSRLRFAVVWTHIGGGSLEPTLRQKARTLPANISWKITGPVANEEVLRFYQTQPADLFVNVSSSEGIPVSIMEAMSFCIPVLATDVGGTSELVDESNGRLLPGDVDAVGLGRALQWFQTLTAEERESKREAARKTWSAKADADKLYTLFTRSLLALCESSGDLMMDKV